MILIIQITKGKKEKITYNIQNVNIHAVCVCIDIGISMGTSVHISIIL